MKIYLFCTFIFIILIMGLGSGNSPSSIKEYYRKSHAIVIGISNYREESSLPNARNDAVAIKRVLAEKYEFDNIISLFNEEATGDKIREILQDTLRDESIIGPKDRVLIYYSGHGKLRSHINWRAEEINTGYIIPYDSRLGRFGASIEMDDLIKSCQGCNAKHIVLILDCCYSGFAVTRDAEPKVPPKRIDKNFLYDITQRKAIQVLAATQKDEPANDSGILPGYSAFTGALLGILKNEEDPIPNGIITASEIGAVLQQQVVNQKGVFQRPSYNVIAGSEGGDFIFKILPEATPRKQVITGGPIKGEQKPWQRRDQKYTCFLSYAHSRGNLINIFVNELKQTLEDYLAAYVPEHIFMDVDRLKPGYNYNETLATAICRSVCMIVVFTPLYQETPYCLREFRAMELLEEEGMAKFRKNGVDTNLRMIIPIVLKGREDLPRKIKQIMYLDFSEFSFTTGKLRRSAKYGKLFQDLTGTIYSLYKNLEELERRGLSQNCDSFVLPTEEEAVKSWGTKSRGVNIGLPFK